MQNLFSFERLNNMYLDRLHIENFLSFDELQSFSLRDRKIFFVGENGCGKSNIIRAIRFVLNAWTHSVDWYNNSFWLRTKPSLLCLEFHLEENDLNTIRLFLQFALLQNDLKQDDLERCFYLAEKNLKEAKLFELPSLIKKVRSGNICQM